jgi:hypothetical protein
VVIGNTPFAQWPPAGNTPCAQWPPVGNTPCAQWPPVGTTPCAQWPPVACLTNRVLLSLALRVQFSNALVELTREYTIESSPLHFLNVGLYCWSFCLTLGVLYPHRVQKRIVEDSIVHPGC